MCERNESKHASLRSRQPQSDSKTDTHINISLLPLASTVVVQNEDREP